MIKKIHSWFHFHNNHLKSGVYIRELQNRKLRKVIEHAYHTSGFYRDLMERAGATPEDIQSAADLKRIPTVTKDDLQKNFNGILSRIYNAEACYMRTTSGSSGKMLRVIWDDFNLMSRFMLYYRAYTMIGYSPFKKLLYFLPEVEDPGFTFGLFRQRGLTLDHSFEEIRKCLLSYRPHILSIYPSYALDLAKQLDTSDIKKAGIEAICLNSEMILEKDRRLIEKRYGCPVYEEYSCVETGVIASMCSDHGMHIYSDNVIVEILDSRGNSCAPGERGEVTLTALNSFAMPLIRYRIGDISSLNEEKCSCGGGLPLLGKIEGRKDDYFLLKNDIHVPAWKIYEAIERPLHQHNIEHLLLNDFYLVQRSLKHADFYYVRGPHFTEGCIDEIITRSRGLFGPDFTIKTSEVKDIGRVKKVKRKYIHSEII